MGSSRLKSRRRQDLGSKWARVAIAILSTVGVIDTGSITLNKWGLIGNLNCLGGLEGCDKVLNSPWGNIIQTNTYSNYDSSASQTNTRASYCYLDSPSTTSETAYKLQVYCYNPGTVLQNEGSNKTTITLMEIAG